MYWNVGKFGEQGGGGGGGGGGQTALIVALHRNWCLSPVSILIASDIR